MVVGSSSLCAATVLVERGDAGTGHRPAGGASVRTGGPKGPAQSGLASKNIAVDGDQISVS
jgi:hypothetical protein